MRLAPIILGAVVGMPWPASGLAQTTTDVYVYPPFSGPMPGTDYSKGDNWLCRPGRQDACAVDLTTTVVAADGKLTSESWTPNPAAPIDCFYVYPTVSTDPTPNSGMIPGPGERAAARDQFARFGSKCRLYAPMYHQITLAALRAQLLGQSVTVDPGLAYGDVLNAWNYYLANDNQGRGVVLIGHSQGTRWLTILIAREIDGAPIQSRLVSALLLGTTFAVPKGKAVGGAFQHIPLCRSPGQIGCVITYASFRATAPPPIPIPTVGTDPARQPTVAIHYGTVPDTAMQAGCTNPAALAGGSAPLHSYFSSRGTGFSSREAQPGPWVQPPQVITTPFVSVPGMLTAECVVNANGSYLAVSVHSSPGDLRVSDIGGDILANGHVLPEWGLHLLDVNLTMGNLLDVVEAQGAAFLSAPANRPRH